MIRSHIACALLLAVGLAAPGHADDYPRNPKIDILHYTFEITLRDESDVITGRTSVTVRFREDGVGQFALDLVGPDPGMHVNAVRSGDEPVEFTHIDDRLELRWTHPSTRNEDRTFTIDYEGVPADGLIISSNRHEERTFFGDSFPDRARHWLPTLDHPSDKATCEFIITAPAHYQVIASGLLIEETDRPAEGTRLTHWEQTIPISTYMMVLGAAHFAVQQLGDVRGIPLSTWVYPQDRRAGFDDFGEAGKAVEFFCDYIAPFPYRKLANVQSRTRYGGMENPGNIFYGERVVRGTRSIEGLIAHEIAHQWFGDAVTTDDWNHVWLSEGFATYFTHLYMEAHYGRDRLVEGLLQDRQRIIRFQDRRPDLAIVDERVPVSEILSPLAYQKGGWVLHMLRGVVGDEQFQAAIREYYQRFQNDNVLTVDFRSVVEEVTGEDLEWFFRQWIHRPGLPEYEALWSYDSEAQRLVLEINQVQTDGPIFEMPLDIGIRLGEDAPLRIESVRIDSSEHTFTFPLDREPTEIVLDPETWVLMRGTIEQREPQTQADR